MTTHALTTAAAKPQLEPTNLRPLNVRRDLGEVADLIYDAFADELDTSGLSALREMRAFGHMGPFTLLLSHFNPDFHDMLAGFVWEEDSQVVGNITVQRVDTYGQRWAIANVAVALPFRGRGIARRLMAVTLDHIRARGGDWAILQVRRDNDVARGLYERLGFEVLGGVSDYRLARVPETVPAAMQPLPGLRSLRADEWYATYELALAATPNLMHWWRPVRADNFRLYFERRLGEAVADMAGHSRVVRLVLPDPAKPNQFLAFLMLRIARWQGTHTLRLFVHPDQRGQIEQALIRHALDILTAYPLFPIHISLQAADQETAAALQQFGFAETRTLLTMRKRL